MAPGFIPTKFHAEKMKKTQKQLQERIESISLKKAGTVEEATGAIMFLLSENAAYIAGQTVAIYGGDWL